MKNKCYGCKERVIGCHSFCLEYKKFREKLEKEKELEKIEKNYNNQIWNYSHRRKKI